MLDAVNFSHSIWINFLNVLRHYTHVYHGMTFVAERVNRQAAIKSTNLFYVLFDTTI